MKTYQLPFAKDPNPVGYIEVTTLCQYSNLKSIPSTSQVTKRMNYELFEEILADLESGIEVEIKG